MDGHELRSKAVAENKQSFSEFSLFTLQGSVILYLTRGYLVLVPPPPGVARIELLEILRH
jgi:hypothetical protein